MRWNMSSYDLVTTILSPDMISSRKGRRGTSFESAPGGGLRAPTDNS